MWFKTRTRQIQHKKNLEGLYLKIRFFNVFVKRIKQKKWPLNWKPKQKKASIYSWYTWPSKRNLMLKVKASSRHACMTCLACRRSQIWRDMRILKFMIKATPPTFTTFSRLTSILHWSVFIRKHFQHLTVIATNNSGNNKNSLYSLYCLNDIKLIIIFFTKPRYKHLSVWGCCLPVFC